MGADTLKKFRKSEFRAQKRYTFDKISADGTTKCWWCKDSVNKCKGRIWTDLNNNFLRLATAHACPANASNVDAQKVKTAIKRRAVTTLEPPSVIRAEALQNVPSPSAILVTKPAAIHVMKGCPTIIKRTLEFFC